MKGVWEITMSMLNNEYVDGFLHKEGTKFVNGNGQQIILNGYGTGNWQNPEGFMIGAPKYPFTQFFQGKPVRFDRRRTVSQVVWELCGSDYLKDFWDRWEQNHLGEADIKAMAEVGFNTVRLVLNANALLLEEPGITFNEKAFSRLDKVIDWCEKYRIYAVLDMHAAPGGACGCCGDSLSNNFPHLFYDDESWERAILLWEEIARRYKDRWIVAGYDLLNEPASLPEEWKAIPLLAKFYDETIARIRKIDIVHMIFLEGPNFARGNQIFDHNYDPYGNNWCMEIHMYGASPEVKELYPYLLKCREYDIPLWIGETGSSPIHNAIFFDLCNAYGVGYSLWCWKTAMEEPGETRCVGYRLPKDWEVIRNYCADGPKPSYAKAQQIFDELLENFKYENCVHNKEFTRISKKQPNITIPGAAYDVFNEDGSRYTGHWPYSNYLNFRMEDKTKLVWLRKDEDLPFPPFEVYPCEQKRYDPLECLALELSENEYANYSVYEVPKTCSISLRLKALERATLDVICNGEKLKRLELDCEAFSEILAGYIGSCEKANVKIEVLSGTVQIQSLIFCKKE